jgi:hypothetical protein
MNKILLSVSMGLLAGVCVAQIPMSKFARTFSSATRVRGFYFQCPNAFVVTHLQVPDESNQGTYQVALYKMTAAPPAWSGSRAETAVAFATGVKSGDRYALKTPVLYTKGEWFGVLGSCGAVSANSYGGANVPSTVLGVAVTLQRFLTQTALGTTGNVLVSNENAGAIARVRVYIGGGGSSGATGCAASNGTPRLMLCDTNPALIGKSFGLNMNSGGATNSGGLLAVGGGKVDIVVGGFGRLCVLPILLILPYGTGAIAAGPAGTDMLIPIPNDNSLIGVSLPFQGALKTTTGGIPLTNGFEITVGK